MDTTARKPHLRAAAALAGTLLDDLPERWTHTRAVALRVADLARTVPAGDREVLLAAAWLHDIGYSPETYVTGFHPLDGALYLERHGWPDRVAALVAHHSGADFVAAARGLPGALDRFPHEHSSVSDALTYADHTVGPHGEPMTSDERLADILARHGPHSPQARAQAGRGPYLRALADRVRSRLADHPA
ncbi:HD domain-containing protein [Actinocatenispora rupis]|uniref:Metal-dependent phosphohydrolase, HD subdomain protein n=1 Tax=Actinocatenispora rupis TaxID=519421 RepID=A0A8J3JIR2_9ACTN|nr:HD domain-containing protein [Actinocatenispora rupis]GID15723.1 metal-dependent phosphohydrolase, HD subdomain protein [Actinocatenispora rupis]